MDIIIGSLVITILIIIRIYTQHAAILQNANCVIITIIIDYNFIVTTYYILYIFSSKQTDFLTIQTNS